MGCGTSKPEDSKAPFIQHAARHSFAVETCGVSMEYLNIFALSVPTQSTVADVVRDVIRPTTQEQACRYWDTIPIQYCGVPSVFISHTWSRKFHDLVQLLNMHFGANTSARIWLDIFSINQHPYVGEKGLLNEDVASLSTVIKATEKTLFCLDAQGVVLTRIWCLYEIWQTVMHKPASHLLVLSSAVNVDELEEIFDALDVAKAQATQDSDRSDILAQIAASSVGHDKLNMMIKKALVESTTFESEQSRAEYDSASGDRTAALRLGAALLKHARMLRIAGQYESAVEPSKMAVQLFEGIEGAGQQQALSEALDNLARVMQANDDFCSAEPLFQRSLQITEQIHGPEHQETAVAANNLADLLREAGRYAEAEELQRRVLRISQLGDEAACSEGGPSGTDSRRCSVQGSLATAAALNNLGNTLYSLGRVSEVLPLFSRSLAIREALMGSDHPVVARAVGNLAVLLKNLGRYDEAEPLYMRALHLKEKAFGGDHPSTATAMGNLAVLLDVLGKYNEAESWYRQALDIDMRALGPTHTGTATDMLNLSLVLKTQQKLVEAESLTRSALAIREQALGAEHLGTASAATALGDLLLELAKQQEQQQQHASSMATDALPSLPSSSREPSALLREAESLCRRALELRRRELGDVYLTAAAANNLANVVQSLGRLQEAEELLRDSLRIRIAVYGREHTTVATAVCNLAALLQERGGAGSEVEQLFREALALHASTLGEDHAKVAGVCEHLARCLLHTDASAPRAGRLAEAEVLARRGLKILEQSLGIKHTDTERLRALLATAVACLEQLDPQASPQVMEG